MCTRCYEEGDQPVPEACPACGEEAGWYVASPMRGETMKEAWERLWGLIGPPCNR